MRLIPDQHHFYTDTATNHHYILLPAVVSKQIFFRNVVHLLPVCFSLANASDHMLLKDVKRLSETHRNSWLLLCYSLVFSEILIETKTAHSRYGQVEQKMTNLSCVPAGSRVWAWAQAAKP